MMNAQRIGHTTENKSDPRRFECVAVFLLGVLLRLPFIPSTVDDAFITFRYVRNLISGQGFVYNVGEHVLGTTTPFYTLYLALAGKAGLDFILVGKLTNIVADVASIVLLFILVFRASNRLLAWVVALLVVSSPYNLQFSASGMETGIYTFLIFLVLYLYEQGRWKAMALAGGVLILVRPDGLLALLVVALFWLSDRQGLKSGIKYAALAGLTLLPWFIFAAWYFGSPIPQSVTAKSLTYRSSVPLEWLQILWHIFAQRGSIVSMLFIVGLVFTGGVTVFLRQAFRPLRPYLVWAVLYIITFTFFQSGRFGWYYSPIMPVLLTLGILGAGEWFEQIKRFSVMSRILQSNLRYVLAGTMIFAIVTTVGISVYASWQIAYEEVAFEKSIWEPLGLCIKENSSPEATVALETIGGIGWYSERYIWDEGGLVSTKAYKLNQETPGDINVFAILQTYHPDFLIVWKPWEMETLNTPNAQTWFKDNYVLVDQYSVGDQTWNLFQLASSNHVDTNLVMNCKD